MRIHALGNSITIDGESRGRTTYAVSIDGALRDTFGQTLGKKATVNIATSSMEPSLQGPGAPMFVMDPKGKPEWSIFSVNHPDLRVRMCRVGPDDWAAWQKYQSSWRDERNPAPLPGQMLSERVVHVNAAPDEMVETRLDLTPALNDGLGQVVVVVEPTVQPAERWNWHAAMSWIQVTHIGLDAMVDDNRMLAWATSLADGKPMANVNVQIWPQNASGTTGQDGTASIDLPNESSDKGNLLVARQGSDLALLPEETSYYSNRGSWVKRACGFPGVVNLRRPWDVSPQRGSARERVDATSLHHRRGAGRREVGALVPG